MASATWLHTFSLSYALRPPSILPAIFHRSSPSGRLFSYLSGSSLPPLGPVHAQAKRGSAMKDEDVASRDNLRFEAPLKIVEYPDPVLRAKNKRIDSFDDNLKKLADEMFDVMYKTDGIGLSAPQVGINVRLMVFNPVGERGEGEEIVLVNPRVNKYSKKVVLFNEGCLSFPGIYADVERPESVKIDAQDIKGARFSVNLSGLPARVFQHEVFCSLIE
ncbi:peptide deformylase 1B, chloroplastic isoform X2 [Carya illinoinensis]|uniref:peptide deformylase 1B, chloroplastic isoform X2 n=1 Tax=Carya illinoinensis TaxID=32201 RepID=UPI001C717CF0|nr:peptide deformylase 1B, chloroplastic isoform X2 [Carya illinoinensis]